MGNVTMEKLVVTNENKSTYHCKGDIPGARPVNHVITEGSELVLKANVGYYHILVLIDGIADFTVGGKTYTHDNDRTTFIPALDTELVIKAKSLVQVLEIVMKKAMPSLYQALGVFLPLITTNCAVLGVAILMIQKEFNLLQSFTYSVSTALGFALALVIFAGIRERLELDDMPKAMQGIPISLIVAAILAMAFMGFSGLV